MSIRPVDLQLLVPKSTEVNRTAQVDARRPEVTQQQFVTQLNKQVEHSQKHVLESNKSEKQSVDENGSNNNRQEQRRKRRNQEKHKMEDQGKQRSTSMFDVSI